MRHSALAALLSAALLARPLAAQTYPCIPATSASYPLAAVTGQPANVQLFATSTSSSARVYVQDTVAHACLGYVAAKSTTPKTWAGYLGALVTQYSRTADTVQATRTLALQLLFAHVAGAGAPTGGSGGGTPPAPPPTDTTAPPLSQATTSVLPTMPQRTVDVTMPTPTRVVAVASGANLQTALNAAVDGDVLELAPGATWTGNYTIPNRGTSGWVLIRPATGVTIPAEGTRLDPRGGLALPKIQTATTAPAITVSPGASGWRIIGVEITAATALTTMYDLVRLGDGQATSTGQLPRRVVLDRVYVHGHPALHVQRCVQVNADSVAIVDSYLADCHTRGQEGQVIGGWSYGGPLRVENNYIEGGTIGMLVGGADPKISGLTPSDITVRRNHFLKPLAWKGVWSAKNAFELKNAQRVLLERNVLENTWVDAQNGFILLFQALSQNNSAPWTTVSDVTIRLNLVKRAPAGVNILSRVAYAYGGVPALLPDSASRRFLIAHNVFDSVGVAALTTTLGSNGRLFQFGTDLRDVTVANNTALQAASHSALAFALAAAVPAGVARFTFTDNVVGKGNYGIIGDGTSPGTPTLTRYAPLGIFSGNVLFGGAAGGTYPAGFGFTLPAGVGAGADTAAVTAAVAGVVVP